ncbi:MAG: hypothetical protein ACPLTR_07955 [Thermacetogeniaceae bacterium]
MPTTTVAIIRKDGARSPNRCLCKNREEAKALSFFNNGNAFVGHKEVLKNLETLRKRLK